MFLTPPPSVTIHILHDNTLTQDNREKFVYIAGRYGQVVKFYNVEKICADKIKEFLQLMPSITSTAYSVASLYRLLAPFVFDKDIKKFIYLDADTIVDLNINELWQICIGDHILAAVPEFSNGVDTNDSFFLCRNNFVKIEDYFNAGVLVINLEKMRNENEHICQGMNLIASDLRYRSFDQDVLNYCFSNDYVKLPRKFNRFVNFAQETGENIVEKKIYHYVGASLTLDIHNEFNRLWLGYFAKTPWFSVETISHLYEGTRQIFIERQNFAIQVSAAMSGKERAFFIPPENLDTAKKIFAISDSEEIIAAGAQGSFQNLIDSMKKSRGKKIFFILVADYRTLGFELTKAGFVEGKDFLNALAFLSDAHSIPLNSYPLVHMI